MVRYLKSHLPNDTFLLIISIWLLSLLLQQPIAWTAWMKSKPVWGCSLPSSVSQLNIGQRRLAFVHMLPYYNTPSVFFDMLPYYTLYLQSSPRCYLLHFFAEAPCSVFPLKCGDDLHLSACISLYCQLVCFLCQLVCFFCLDLFLQPYVIPSPPVFDTVPVSSPCLLVLSSCFSE